MPKEKRGPNRINKMIEEQVYFREHLEALMEQYRKYIESSMQKIRIEITRLSRGQKQLIDWTGMVFNCYIPKDLCRLNLSLMGIPVTDELFDKYAELNKYSKPIRKDKDGELLYNFKNVFKFFVFSCTEKPIKELRRVNIEKPITPLAQKQADIMAKSIMKLEGSSSFFFDIATQTAFEKQVYGENFQNKAQIKPSNEETNEKQ